MKVTSNTILTFGKYKGKVAKEVLDIEPKYFLWLDDNTDHNVSNTLYREALDYLIEQEHDNAWDECVYDIY